MESVICEDSEGGGEHSPGLPYNSVTSSSTMSKKVSSS